MFLISRLTFLKAILKFFMHLGTAPDNAQPPTPLADLPHLSRSKPTQDWTELPDLTDLTDRALLDELVSGESLEPEVEVLFNQIAPLELRDVTPVATQPSSHQLCLTHLATTKALVYHLQAVVAEFVPTTPGISPHPLTHLTAQLLTSVEATQRAIGAWVEPSVPS